MCSSNDSEFFFLGCSDTNRPYLPPSHSFTPLNPHPVHFLADRTLRRSSSSAGAARGPLAVPPAAAGRLPPLRAPAAPGRGRGAARSRPGGDSDGAAAAGGRGAGAGAGPPAAAAAAAARGRALLPHAHAAVRARGRLPCMGACKQLLPQPVFSPLSFARPL